LNYCLGQHRAAQLQHKQLALLFAEMGYPDASRQEAAKIPAASVRLLSEMLGRLTTGHLLVEKGDLATAARLLPEVEDLMRRGIACGAFADPWNILGFQGLFPLFTAREDSIRDPRIDELIYLVEHVFNFYARVLSEGAAAGQGELVRALLPTVKKLAGWWDKFATTSVGDVRRLSGEESAASAEHVARALAKWHERGEATADLAFWRDQVEGFRSPKAFALVVDALLRKEDYRASMALLMNWLGQAEQVSLEDGVYSFSALSLQWMMSLTTRDDPEKPGFALVRKFFDFLEANAEDYWQVPSLDSNGTADKEKEEKEDLYGAAYEDVTYQDSTDNDEGAVVDGGGPAEEFDLEEQGEPLLKRLRFLSTVARMWVLAARRDPAEETSAAWKEALSSWRQTAMRNHQGLLVLLDAVHERKVPAPLGSYESLVEFDRRRVIKDQLLYTAIGTCLDTALAVGALQAALAQPDAVLAMPDRPPWEPLAIQIEHALLRGDAARTRSLLPPFLRLFQQEPLLFTSLADGGSPRQILRVRTAQNLLRTLATLLPRLGLLRETGQLLKTAQAMEQAHPTQGRGVTEFNHLFEAAFQSVVRAVIESSATWKTGQDASQELIGLLEKLAEPFLQLWIEHSQTLQLSSLETFRTDEQWEALGEFVRRYGRDLFHARFLTLGNLRGILHRGVGAYLEYIRENPDPLRPVRLLDDLDRVISRADAERFLQSVLQAVVENYEEYKDYNTSTTHSDYGENLHTFLEFLRLKANYDRHAWEFRPLILTHEVLARQRRTDAAVQWEEAFTAFTSDLARHYIEELEDLERVHGIRLRTVSDRVQERFVKPLAHDRLCALIAPAMEQAGKAGEGVAFGQLQEELLTLTATPTGVGLDVPHWLRRLEAEVQRVRGSRTAVASLVESLFRVPWVTLTQEEVYRQLAEWDAN
jgi:hypothetical protein